MQIEGERLTSNNTAVNTPVLSFPAVYQSRLGQGLAEIHVEVATCAVKQAWLVWFGFQMLENDFKGT